MNKLGVAYNFESDGNIGAHHGNILAAGCRLGMNFEQPQSPAGISALPAEERKRVNGIFKAIARGLN